MPAGVWRAQIMRQLPSIQRALIGFEGIYTGLSGQILHACGMTSFWSPQSRPGLLLLLILPSLLPVLGQEEPETRDKPSSPVHLRLSRVSPDRARHSACRPLIGAQHRCIPPPFHCPPLLSSAPSIYPVVFTIGERAVDYKSPRVRRRPGSEELDQRRIIFV